MYLNLAGFHIACMISLSNNIKQTSSILACFRQTKLRLLAFSKVVHHQCVYISIEKQILLGEINGQNGLAHASQWCRDFSSWWNDTRRWNASPSHAPAQQQDTCKDLGGRRNLACSCQHMQAPPVKWWSTRQTRPNKAVSSKLIICCCQHTQLQLRKTWPRDAC